LLNYCESICSLPAIFSVHSLMMKVLHTADWHLGQQFFLFDRSYEHQQFLEWLLVTLHKEEIDVLLISGDVFDVANPSAASIRLFYSFLQRAVNTCPGLQIIATAGNHDSAARLESARPLVDSQRIHLIGLVEKNEVGETLFDKLIIPLYKRGNAPQMEARGMGGKEISGRFSPDRSFLPDAFCLAVPFLRLGDYPSLPQASNPYVEGVTLFYQQAVDHLKRKFEGAIPVPLIAMGHLHAQQAEVSDLDKMERAIMGGVESIPAAAFPKEVQYVALGHIHKAQMVGGKNHIRYCGSPLPMSFSEHRYKHQVLLIRFEESALVDIQSLAIPVAVPLLRVPSTHQPLTVVLEELTKLRDQFASGPSEELPTEQQPYLEVRVQLNGPEPGIRHQVEQVLQNQPVRLVKIDVKYPKAEGAQGEYGLNNEQELEEIQPIDLLEKIHQQKFGTPTSAELKKRFMEIMNNEDFSHQD
jgi:exonuclease SbcD